MNEVKRKFGLKHGLGLMVALIVVVSMAVLYIGASGIADHWARRAIIQQLGKATGASVELGRVHVDWWRLGAEFDGLTLRGREPEGTPPLFHADRIRAGVRVDSFWGRKISLGSVELSHFSVHFRVEKDGSTNIPAPKASGPPGKPAAQNLFDLKIARLALLDGEILWNDTSIPLVAEGGNFEFGMDYAVEAAKPLYLGHVSWNKFNVAALRYIPFTSDVSARFTLRPDSFSLTQLQWKIPRSEIDAQAELTSFLQPAWNFRYRGQIDFDELFSILRKADTPAGRVEFTGSGNVRDRQVSVTGGYTADSILMKYRWFHPGVITSRGSYRADQHSLEVPDLVAHVLGGEISSRLRFDFSTQKFRVESKVNGLDLKQALAAEDNPSLPIIPLHWGSRIDADVVTTWLADFKHVDSHGITVWTPPASPPPGQIPTSARFDYHYEMDLRQVELGPSIITTPSSRIDVSGALGMRDSALDATVDTEDLSLWGDFINRLRGADAVPQAFGGKFHWRGRMTGRLDGPTFEGYAKGTQARYGNLYWDTLEGQLTYSPDELSFVRARVHSGRSTADMDVSLALDNWSFAPESAWSVDAHLTAADSDDLQKLLGTSYPARGTVSGEFHGKGTRADPQFTALLDIVSVTAWNWRINRARGELTARHGEVRIANAELRLPASAAGASSGLLTGNFLYHTDTRQVAFDVTGAAIALDSIEKIQSPSMRVGGSLNLQVRGEGDLRAPQLHGTVRLVDLKLAGDIVGSFDGKLDSDGHHLSATVNSAMKEGQLSGKLDVTLGNDYPVVAEILAKQIKFDPFIVSGVHLTRWTGHSLVDGHFAIAGFAAHPETIAVEANLSHVTLDYQNVKLENVGPVRLTYRRDEVRVEQANLRGTDTDFHVAGFARFTGDRALNLRVDGAVSFPLLAGFVPRLEATGRASINVAVAGTLSNPRFNGKVHVESGAFRYGDFPTGLSNVAGDFNFDATRLTFENVTAESGGGHLTIGGALAYGEGPVSYSVNVRSDQVRIRYPVGMSWLAGGTLRLSGNAQSATLSGRIVVDRLLMAEGLDLASFMASAKQPTGGTGTDSPFLQNLQFDIQGESSPDSRMEWSGARLQTDASLRLRGTWEHPILVGHIHLLSGEMSFRGNQYTIARGDINFANPFRLDPVLNVEATTTIRQYEVTLDFTGPASRLTLAYRSDPPLPSSDIIELLALGQTTGESTARTATGQNAGVGASALLSEAISSQLGGRIERLFGISHFQVGPSVTNLASTQQNSIASVTIEQQIRHNLVVTYITNVNSTQYQIIQVEYTINREFSVVALRDENGTFGLDIVRKTRFK